MLAIIAGLSVLTMFTGRVYTHANAADVPAGHPHNAIRDGETTFSCASLVSYAAGDRDPLCRGSQRFSVSFLVPSFLLVIGFSLLAGWARRRGRTARGLDPRARPGWRKAVVRVSWAPAAITGILVVLVTAVTYGVDPNGGNWVTTATTPPAVPGLAEWRAQVQPLVSELSGHARSLGDTFDGGGVVDPAGCEALQTTVTRLDAAAIPAPDPELDDLVRDAVAAMHATATACTQAARTPDALASLSYGIRWSSAARGWLAVTDRLHELRLGPG